MRLQTNSNPYKALNAFISAIGYDDNVLNIGDVKDSPHNLAILEKANSTTISYNKNADIIGDFNQIELQKYDNVWCAHCLEHQRNVGFFLDKLHGSVKEGGWVCVTIPPLKTRIVGGHLTLWNGGLLLYNIILSGVDLSEARLLKDGYNISVLYRKKTISLPPLVYDTGDIEALAPYFPIKVSHGFNGDLENVSWPL